MKRLRIVTVVLAAAAIGAFAHLAAAQPASVRIGQAVPTMSFLPILAARALGSFDAQQLKLEFTQIRGGDPRRSRRSIRETSISRQSDPTRRSPRLRRGNRSSSSIR